MAKLNRKATNRYNVQRLSQSGVPKPIAALKVQIDEIINRDKYEFPNGTPVRLNWAKIKAVRSRYNTNYINWCKDHAGKTLHVFHETGNQASRIVTFYEDQTFLFIVDDLVLTNLDK